MFMQDLLKNLHFYYMRHFSLLLLLLLLSLSLSLCVSPHLHEGRAYSTSFPAVRNMAVMLCKAYSNSAGNLSCTLT